jgi:iron complex outermembrane receptor protein
VGQAVALNRNELLLLSPPTGASVDSTSYAAFAQGTWRPGWLTDKISLTAGVRFGHDDKEAVRPVGVIYESVPWSSKNPQPAFETCPCAPRKIEEDKVNPMFSIAYDWTDDVNTYFRYSTGYLAPNLSVGSQLFAYDKSGDVESYEVGLKSEWAEHTLRFNVAAFWSEWQDVHESLQTTSASTVEFYNSPKLEVSGVELDATWLPTESFSLTLAAAYNNGDKASGGVPPDLIDPTGGGTVATNNIVQLPELAWSVNMNWDVATFGWATFRVNADVNHVDEFWSNPQVTVPADSRTLLNARLSLADMQVMGGTLDLTLWGTNLTDEEYKVFNYEAPGITGAPTFGVFGDPRMYGLTATLKF